MHGSTVRNVSTKRSIAVAWKVLRRTAGSVFPESIPVAFGSAVLSLVFLIIRRSGYGGWFSASIQHPFAVQVFGIMFGFFLTNRVGLAIARWWKGTFAVSTMSSKWMDTCIQVVAFVDSEVSFLEGEERKPDLLPQQKDALQRKIEQLHDLKDRMVHWCSLMSAMAVAALWAGNNKYVEFAKRLEPKSDPRQFQMKHRLSRTLTTELEKGIAKVELRIENPYLGNGSAQLISLELIGDLTSTEQEILHSKEDKTLAVMRWIIEGLTLAHNEQLLTISAPILSRCYQELSNGVLGYNMALRVAELQYPFPLQQMMMLMMNSFVLMMPVIVEKFTQALILTPVLTFFIVLGYWGLNAAAIQLESPFGDSVNDLTLGESLERMNARIREAGVDSLKVNDLFTFSGSLREDLWSGQQGIQNHVISVPPLPSKLRVRRESADKGVAEVQRGMKAYLLTQQQKEPTRHQQKGPSEDQHEELGGKPSVERKNTRTTSSVKRYHAKFGSPSRSNLDLEASKAENSKGLEQLQALDSPLGSEIELQKEERKRDRHVDGIKSDNSSGFGSNFGSEDEKLPQTWEEAGVGVKKEFYQELERMPTWEEIETGTSGTSTGTVQAVEADGAAGPMRTQKRSPTYDPSRVAPASDSIAPMRSQQRVATHVGVMPSKLNEANDGTSSPIRNQQRSQTWNRSPMPLPSADLDGKDAKRFASSPPTYNNLANDSRYGYQSQAAPDQAWQVEDDGSNAPTRNQQKLETIQSESIFSVQIPTVESDSGGIPIQSQAKAPTMQSRDTDNAVPGQSHERNPSKTAADNFTLPQAVEITDIAGEASNVPMQSQQRAPTLQGPDTSNGLAIRSHERTSTNDWSKMATDGFLLPQAVAPIEVMGEAQNASILNQQEIPMKDSTRFMPTQQAETGMWDQAPGYWSGETSQLSRDENFQERMESRGHQSMDRAQQSPMMQVSRAITPPTPNHPSWLQNPQVTHVTTTPELSFGRTVSAPNAQGHEDPPLFRSQQRKPDREQFQAAGQLQYITDSMGNVWSNPYSRQAGIFPRNAAHAPNLWGPESPRNIGATATYGQGDYSPVPYLNGHAGQPTSHDLADVYRRRMQLTEGDYSPSYSPTLTGARTYGCAMPSRSDASTTYGGVSHARSTVDASSAELTSSPASIV